MTEVTNQEVNPADQATIATIEAALSNAINTFTPTQSNSIPMSTDPISPVHHINLIDNIADITDYINEQTQKHKELMIHIDALREKLGSVSSDMKSYHVEDKFATVKKIIAKEEKAFLGLTTAHKIEMAIVGVIAIGIIIAAIKFI